MNVKKLFPEKKLSRKGLLEFLDKKGFYVVLILCIAVVGVTAVFLSMQNMTQSDNEFGSEKVIPEENDIDSILNAQEPTSADSSLHTDISTPTPDVAVNTSPKETAEKTPQATLEKKEDTKKDAKSTEPSKKPSNTNKQAAPKAISFVMPVFGEICFEYAQDKLVFSKTLEEWRTHSGVDIAADRGTPVKAVADGVVREIKDDPRYGITVIIEHDNGLKTVYANLASDEMLTPNQKVKQSEVIGSVGNTATFESAEQPHLHFEVWKNNEPADPIDYLPNK